MSALLFTLLSCLVAAARCQVVDSQNAAILKDSRYLSGDGTFGASYTQDDGVEFKEESDEYGNRRGSYSYVDPTGQRRTVTYTAGVNGFQASGDHIPAQPAPTPPQPEYVPLAQYNPPDYQPPARAAPAPPPHQPRYQLVRRPYQPEYEAHQESAYEQQQQQQRYAGQQTVRVPAPRYNRPPPPPPLQTELLQYQSAYVDYPGAPLRYDSAAHQALGPIGPQYRPVARPAPPPPPPPPSRYHYNEITTPVPRRFYPPGKLDFNRTPDGFSYTFSKS